MLLALNDRLQHTCQLGKVAGEFDVDVSAALLRHHFGQCLLDGLQRGFDVGAAALVAQNGHKLTIRRNDRALCKVGDFSDTREVKAYRVPSKRVCERYAVDFLNDPVDRVDQTIQDAYNCIDGCECDGL